MPDPVIPAATWERLRALLAEVKAARRSCRVVVIVN